MSAVKATVAQNETPSPMGAEALLAYTSQALRLLLKPDKSEEETEEAMDWVGRAAELLEEHEVADEAGEPTIYIITRKDSEYGYRVFEALVLGPPGQKLDELYFKYRDDVFTTVLGRPFRSMGDDEDKGAVTWDECLRLRAAGYRPLVWGWLDMDMDERGYGLMDFARNRMVFIGWLCKHHGFTLPLSADVQGVDFWEYRKRHEDYRG